MDYGTSAVEDPKQHLLRLPGFHRSARGSKAKLQEDPKPSLATFSRRSFPYAAISIVDPGRGSNRRTHLESTSPFLDRTKVLAFLDERFEETSFKRLEMHLSRGTLPFEAAACVAMRRLLPVPSDNLVLQGPLPFSLGFFRGFDTRDGVGRNTLP